MSDAALLPHMLELAAIGPDRLPQDARKMAELSLFDWMAVSLAGADQPLAHIIRDFVAAEGGVAKATVTGSKLRLPARAAALANGTISHALDYDDTHFAYIGHPSVAIFPAALAAAEDIGASANDVVDAFLVGAESACRIGMVLGRDHYDAGFHQTATSGAFGATIAASRLYQLDRAATRAALGLVSTRASGLKSQFGTMGKTIQCWCRSGKWH
jgi:2-methylcitrate dehydratase PrpD